MKNGFPSYKLAIVLFVFLLVVPMGASGQADAPWTGPEFRVDDPVTYSPANAQRYPSVAFDGANYLVVWADEREGSWNVYGVRISEDGSILDSDAICFFPGLTGNQSSYSLSAAVAFGSSYYLVTGTLADGSYAQRVAPDGTLIGVPIATGGGKASASDGTNFLLLSNDDDYVYGERVSENGVLLDDPPFVISPYYGTDRFPWFPHAAFGGGVYLVGWGSTKPFTSLLLTFETWVARVAQDGTVLDPTPIEIYESSPDESIRQDIASDGTDFLVAFANGVKLIDQSGVVTEPGWSHYSWAHEVVFDGTNYVITFRSGGDDTFAMRITPSGDLVDDPPFDFFDNPYAISNGGDRASNGDGEVLYSWSQNDSDPTIDKYRVRLRIAGFEDPCDGCVIDGTCYPDGWKNPDNGCLYCDEFQSDIDWSIAADGAICADDGLFCNGEDTCAAGICVAGSTNPCAEDLYCNDDTDQCNAANGTTLILDPSLGWTQTEVMVETNVRLNVTVSGKVTFGDRNSTEPDGLNEECGDGCPIPTANRGALIGRIAGSTKAGEPFVIGSSYSQEASEAGDLEVNVNDDDLSDNTGLFSLEIELDNETGIELISFSAVDLEGVVLLSWETATESDNAGFHVWRSESEAGSYARITEALVPTEGNEFTGAQYSLNDADVAPGKTYFYKLEDVNLMGQSTLHGPVNVTLQNEEPFFGCGLRGGSDSLAGLVLLLLGFLAVVGKRKQA